MIGPQAVGVLEALHEPALLLTRDGSIAFANRAFKRILGEQIAGRDLSDFAEDDAGRIGRYLERCLGSGDPLIGSMHIRAEGRPRKLQCKGNAVLLDDENLVLLRLSGSGVPRFASLTETVGDLREELKRRKQSEAMLEESVRERELLLRELEHRVKNNMQMLSALLSSAEREASSPEAKAALRDASLKFSAVRTVQQLLYRSDDIAAIGSQPLVRTLVETVSMLSAQPMRTEVNVEPIDLPIESAVLIGLILNELLTNALKHGRPRSGTQSLHVDFVSQEGKIYLAVQDNGPGFDPPVSLKRASGIGLIRGLLRQLGGSFAVEHDSGSRCVVTFPAPSGALMRNSQ